MIAPEFSRILRVSTLRAADTVQDVQASTAECAALARRCDLPAIAEFSCRFTLHPEDGGVIAVTARLRARLTQICVVSLDPFTASLNEPFRLRLVPAGQEVGDDDPEADDELPYELGPNQEAQIDLGEIAAEQLALVLDPYPRKPGMVLEMPEAPDVAHPFATLLHMKQKD